MTILHNVLQRFTKPAAKASSQPATEFVNKLQQYTSLLELQGRRQFIEVLIENSDCGAHSHSLQPVPPQSYQSLIVAINTEASELTLDELFPACVRLQQGHKAIFRYSQGNHMLQFEMTLLGHHDHGSLVFSLPKTLNYQPRRQQPRLLIDKSQPLTVQLQSPTCGPWFATAQNISAGGMRVTIGGNITDQLEPGSFLRQCDFTFSRDFHIRCQARVIGFRFSRKPYRHTQVSLEFVGLPGRQQLQLSQMINTLTGQSVAA